MSNCNKLMNHMSNCIKSMDDNQFTMLSVPVEQ